MDFLPKHFGARAMMKFEMSVYDWMGNLCPSYRGGYWDYVELSNGGAFMYPAGVDAFEFTVEGNGFHGTVSAEVAGIIATTFALNGMLWRGWDSLNAKYELLQEFIGDAVIVSEPTPSTSTTLPVTQLPAGEASQRAAAAMSSPPLEHALR